MPSNLLSIELYPSGNTATATQADRAAHNGGTEGEEQAVQPAAARVGGQSGRGQDGLQVHHDPHRRQQIVHRRLMSLKSDTTRINEYGYYTNFILINIFATRKADDSAKPCPLLCTRPPQTACLMYEGTFS